MNPLNPYNAQFREVTKKVKSKYRNKKTEVLDIKITEKF